MATLMKVSKKMQKSESFYNEFGKKLIEDYIIGNPRMLSALDFMERVVRSHGPTSVLDIGCGIGWSSFRLATNRGIENIQAVDLASNSIAIAGKLFAHPKIKFSVQDVTEMDSKNTGAYGAIVLLDVYEHIPLEARPEFHAALKRLLAPNGVIILTAPTIRHQNFLRSQKPEGLQPVDEDVGLDQLMKLASDIGGSVSFYREKSIWSSCDYLHCAIAASDAAPALADSRNSRLRRRISSTRVKLKLGSSI